MSDFDLIVIGSGPAGEKGAAQAAYFGKRVALIEKEAPPAYGGAAANTGTLPSKTLRETALFLSGFKNRELEGIEFRWKESADIRSLMGRRRTVVGREQKRIATNLDRHEVRTFEGFARFAGPHTVAVGRSNFPEKLYTADVILIATGSRPYRPPEFRVDDPRIVDSDTILSINEIPKSMLVVGGGVIGCEYACMFAIMGTKVTLIERRDKIMGFLDVEIVEALLGEMERLGIRIHLNESIENVEYGTTLQVQTGSGEVLEPELVLISSGRSGNTEGLNVEGLGIEIDSRGRINVDNTFQTTVPYVYAAGDVIKGPALASTAMEQGRIAMVHAFELPFQRGLTNALPYGIYTIPECSMVGETEASLLEQNIPFVAGKASYQSNARGQIIGDTSGFLKLLYTVEQEPRLVGVHVIGEAATELVHIGLTAMQLGAVAGTFIKSCYNYPTLSELYKYATYSALGELQKKRQAESA